MTSTTLFVGWPLTSGIERVALLAVLPGLAAAGGGAMVGHSLLESEDVGVPLGIGLATLALGPVLVGGLTLGVGALAGGLLAFLWSRTVGRDTR